MAQTVIDAASQDIRPIAVLATVGTLRAGIYQRYFEKAGWQVLTPEGEDQEHIIDAIAAVKRGEIERARASFDIAAASLLALGAGRLLLACTELPVAAKGSIHEDHCLDATVCLARACVAFSCNVGSKDV